MRYLQSLRARTAAIVLAGLVCSNAVGFLLYSVDRHESLLLADAFDIAERAGGVSRLVRDLPKNWEPAIVQAADSRAFRVWTTEAPPIDLAPLDEDEKKIADYFLLQVPRIASNTWRIWFKRGLPPDLDVPEQSSRLITVGGPTDYGNWTLVIGIDHGDGHWLNFFGHVAPENSNLPAFLAINLAIAAVAMGAVALWLVARVTQPLLTLAQAASQLGNNLRSHPLPEDGPREVSIAARAFNEMQRKLIRQIEGRTRMLAAISHDLRTPITQMRLRSEMLFQSEDREKALASLDEMNAIIGTFLDYARASNDSEAKTLVDLTSLVESICDDFSDSGHDVQYDFHERILLACKRVAMRRALVNVIENAVHYGRKVQVHAKTEGATICIIINDFGPGISEENLEMVFEPFVCLDSSRSRGAESMGLGLSIAIMIAEDHGGTITLQNRAEGGLRAELRFPV